MRFARAKYPPGNGKVDIISPKVISYLAIFKGGRTNIAYIIVPIKRKARKYGTGPAKYRSFPDKSNTPVPIEPPTLYREYRKDTQRHHLNVATLELSPPSHSLLALITRYSWLFL